MHEAGADQLAYGAAAGVLGVAAVGVGMKDEDQLVHREPGRVFVEEKRQDRALGLLVLPCRGEGIEPCATRRVLISHEERGLLVVRPSVGVPPPAGGRFTLSLDASRIKDISPLADY